MLKNTCFAMLLIKGDSHQQPNKVISRLKEQIKLNKERYKFERK